MVRWGTGTGTGRRLVGGEDATNPRKAKADDQATMIRGKAKADEDQAKANEILGGQAKAHATLRKAKAKDHPPCRYHVRGELK